MNAPLDPRWQDALALSRYLTTLFAARPELAGELATTWHDPLSEDLLVGALKPATEDEAEFAARLRRLRQRAMAHIALRDLCGLAPLAEVVESMTMLADVTTNHALAFHHRRQAAQHGEPLDGRGQAQRLLVVGMGKLGGRELNVSSDVDYIFVYPENGETAGPRRIQNQEFFTRLGKRLIAALGDITADGQVFRVDMRLRPNGDSGPLVCSLDALENYFITQGREWERYAWIKARVMNTGVNEQPEAMAALKRVSRPFVFRKYLDFGAINAMRDLHVQIRREVARKDMADHVKLGPGGIREIEFIAQVFQLIRGGRDPALQVRPTLSVLKLLVERRLIPPATEAELREAYVFLRGLEHRLQYVEDKQTHRLPDDAGDRERIARSLGAADWSALAALLDRHREAVSRHFEQVFSDPENGDHALAGVWLGHAEADAAAEALGEVGYRHPDSIVERLDELRQSSRYRQLPTQNRERLDAVGPRLLEAAARCADPDEALARGLAFLETISRRGAYLALLQQYPQALKRVADIVGASSWASEYLNRHPILLDELLDPRLLEVATDWTSFAAELDQNLADHAGDAEREMDILREMHHAQVFRLLAQDLAGLHSIERISDHLSDLADILVRRALDLSWSKLRQRHCEHPRFAVIGYGKLGGKELGYGSDLDLVYLYEDPSGDAGENYGKLGQRLNTWLSSRTPAGILFETDLRLRPNGDSGLLAVSLEAFRDYQLHHAWVWEHQALSRARFVAGDSRVGEGFEAVRREILCLERDPASLRDEVAAMRQKMLDAHGSKTPGEFDLKHDRGGIIDVEFIVQYLILAHARRHPELCGNLGNIALLAIAAGLGLIPADLADGARDAYREYRRLQHLLRLNAAPKARVERALAARQIDAVSVLWHRVFG
ncbi:MAG: bifunctional [glutamate--ammonia ligase]-adenylyl-L-tyrosine phosphorylase/[glutamate--ammonia-ligase] adenylyltransferase [Dechloromonas sp.]|jgi:glutamate-ammonia-ligase adenylyltransferase|nr:bifunctional [glutamate--ammonia ligase]-adenylyl-L-tyrosine phosphorylase/[glutamate--ammonia-ligase] adenylyltransferase [Dechloromonas sp.]